MLGYRSGRRLNGSDSGSTPAIRGSSPDQPRSLHVRPSGSVLPILKPVVRHAAVPAIVRHKMSLVWSRANVAFPLSRRNAVKQS